MFATVTISGPGRNLLDPAGMARLVAELRGADEDPEVTGIVITGAGDDFCAGLDIEAIRAGADPVVFATALVELLGLIPRLGTAVIARVNGDALASGAAIVAACDYAVALDGVQIGTVEVGAGIWPMVAQVPLIHRLGARAAMENIGAGIPFAAERARELGLINEVAMAAELDARVEARLVAASRGATVARLGRPLLYELADLPYDAALQRALAAFSAMFPAPGPGRP
jgi:enoyl-CoA hydratase/carnithine racemase